MLLFAVRSVSSVASVGEERGVLSPLRCAGKSLLSKFGVGEVCGVAASLRWVVLELEACCWFEG